MYRLTEGPLNVYFLDVGQGDSELVVLPGGVKILADGGPDKEVLFELDRILPATDRYIDLLVVSHAQLDHFGGLRDVLDRYRVGAVLFNGREGTGSVWGEFRRELTDENVPLIVIGGGDKIVYGDNYFDVLSPSGELLQEPDLNDTSLVMKLVSGGAKILFTGDIGPTAEEYLVGRSDIDVDVLKVAHHGSRYSTSQAFVDKASPALSVIEVGINNTFGHPAESVLQRLWRAGSIVYRTDQNGRVRLVIRDGKIGVAAEES